MNSAPISRRMSNRLAVLAASISSSSVSPVGAIGSSRRAGIAKRRFSSSGIGQLLDLDEDDVQDHEDRQRDSSEQVRGAPPQLVARIGVLLAFLGTRETPHQAA